MGIKISIFVVSVNGTSFHGMMYGEYEAAKNFYDEAKKYDRRDKVEINKETFDESEIYFAGDHPEYGPIYSLLSEINKKSVPWSEKFKPTGPMDKSKFFTKGK